MLCWIDTHGTGEPLLRGLDASYRRDDIVLLCVRRESTVAPTGQARQPVQRLALGPRRGWVGHQGRRHARPAADGGSADDGSEGRPRGTVVLLTDLPPVPVGRSGRSPMHVDGLGWAARPTAVVGQDLVVAVVTR